MPTTLRGQNGCPWICPIVFVKPPLGGKADQLDAEFIYTIDL